MLNQASISKNTVLCISNKYSANITAPQAEALTRRAKFDLFTLSHHRGVVAPEKAAASDTAVSKEDVATANLMLAKYGITMSKELLEACIAASVDSFHVFYGILTAMVAAVSKSMDNAVTVWPNYPYDVMNASMVELYFANLFNYISGGTWQPGFDIKVISPALSMEKVQALKVIPLCHEDGAVSLAKELLTNSVPMNPDDIADIKVLMEDSDFAKALMSAMVGTDIPVKENLALYIALTMKMYGSNLFKQKFLCGLNTAKDVLRIAAACSDGDVSLYKNTKFRNFTRAERRLMLHMIEQTNFIEESMASNPEQWKRLGEKLHPGDYEREFSKTEKAFAKIRAGVHIETYNSILERLLKAPVNAVKLANHLKARPGMFARYLDTCIRNCRNEDEISDVRFMFASVAKDVSPRVLVQVINHFRNRNNPVSIAVGRQKGMKGRNIIRVAAPISKDVCSRLCQDITNELWQVMRNGKDVTPSVYLDPACRCDKLIFPDNVRQLSSGDRVAACGSRFNLPEADIIRLFLFWKGKEENPYAGIDLDLSVLFLDGEMNDCGNVSYFSPRFSDYSAVHSGDRRSSGPYGAVEYIDFDINAAKAHGVRYAVMFVNSFSGQLFDSGMDSFCGIMARDGTGDTFEPRTVSNRFNLTCASRDCVPLVVDLVTREVTIIDRAAGASTRSNVSDSSSSVVYLCRYATGIRSLTISEMIRFRYPSIVAEPEQADVIISEDPDKFTNCKDTVKVLNPFDTQGIVSFVLES